MNAAGLFCMEIIVYQLFVMISHLLRSTTACSLKIDTFPPKKDVKLIDVCHLEFLNTLGPGRQKGCQLETKYSAIYFASFNKYFVEFMQLEQSDISSMH